MVEITLEWVGHSERTYQIGTKHSQGVKLFL